MHRSLGNYSNYSVWEPFKPNLTPLAIHTPQSTVLAWYYSVHEGKLCVALYGSLLFFGNISNKVLLLIYSNVLYCVTPPKESSNLLEQEGRICSLLLSYLLVVCWKSLEFTGLQRVCLDLCLHLYVAFSLCVNLCPISPFL